MNRKKNVIDSLSFKTFIDFIDNGEIWFERFFSNLIYDTNDLKSRFSQQNCCQIKMLNVREALFYYYISIKTISTHVHIYNLCKYKNNF